jgi:hypothetical protein
MNDNGDENLLLSISQLARIVGVSRQYLHQEMGGGITYSVAKGFLKDKIARANSDAERWQEGLDAIEEIHNGSMRKYFER